MKRCGINGSRAELSARNRSLSSTVVLGRREKGSVMLFRLSVVALFLGWMPATTALASSADWGLPLSGREAEEFLREAEVVGMKPIGVGITRPFKATLTDGKRTAHAVWKTIDDVRQGVFKGSKGGFQANLRDSYKYEVAAYELDRMLGLGLVPPTVAREIDGREGSLQLWVEGAFTELDRREKGLLPDDYVAWSDQLYKLELLEQLVFNSDSKNIRNVVYDPSFRVYAVDHSRSFRKYRYLDSEKKLRRFSRALLERLARLDRVALEQGLGRYLDSDEIVALLVRRDLLLEIASVRSRRFGDAAVLYP
jgi:hypothetical protein